PLRRREIDARVGDTLTVHELRARLLLLTTGDQVALDHHAEDVSRARANLLAHVREHRRLVLVVLAGVVVAAVDEHARLHAGARQRARRRFYVGAPVVRAAAASAQHEVRVRVARGADHADAPVAVDAQETVRLRRRDHRVDGDGEAAVRAVLEPDGHGEPARHFAVGLALRRSRADG